MMYLKQLSKAATIILFIALIRTIFEPIRLQSISKSALEFQQIRPYILGAGIVAIGLFVMQILTYYSKHMLVIIIAVCLIICMLLIKYFYIGF